MASPLCRQVSVLLKKRGGGCNTFFQQVSEENIVNKLLTNLSLDSATDITLITSLGKSLIRSFIQQNFVPNAGTAVNCMTQITIIPNLKTSANCNITSPGQKIVVPLDGVR